MREIKFRYRFEREKRIDTIIIFLEAIERSSVIQKYFSSNWKILSRDQFTGLKDKNGKEIYEGDIIKSTYGYGRPITKVTLEDFFYWEGESYISDDIEVIGNIYENPELLNKE